SAADDGPAGQGEDGLHGHGAADEEREPGFEPAGLALGLIEAVAVLTPREGEHVAVVNDLVEHEAGAAGALAAGLGFDGEDAGGTDEDVVDVEGTGVVFGGHVVEDLEATGLEGVEGLGDDAFAEVAEVEIAGVGDAG